MPKLRGKKGPAPKSHGKEHVGRGEYGRSGRGGRRFGQGGISLGGGADKFSRSQPAPKPAAPKPAAPKPAAPKPAAPKPAAPKPELRPSDIGSILDQPWRIKPISDPKGQGHKFYHQGIHDFFEEIVDSGGSPRRDALVRAFYGKDTKSVQEAVRDARIEAMNDFLKKNVGFAGEFPTDLDFRVYRIVHPRHHRLVEEPAFVDVYTGKDMLVSPMYNPELRSWELKLPKQSDPTVRTKVWGSLDTTSGPGPWGNRESFITPLPHQVLPFDLPAGISSYLAHRPEAEGPYRAFHMYGTGTYLPMTNLELSQYIRNQLGRYSDGYTPKTVALHEVGGHDFNPAIPESFAVSVNPASQASRDTTWHGRGAYMFADDHELSSVLGNERKLVWRDLGLDTANPKDLAEVKKIWKSWRDDALLPEGADGVSHWPDEIQRLEDFRMDPEHLPERIFPGGGFLQEKQRVRESIIPMMNDPSYLRLHLAAKGGRSAADGPEATSVPPGSGAPQDSGPRIVVNPKVFSDGRDALCVAWNEAFRLVMEENEFIPQSEPTDGQRKFFSDTAYSKNEEQLRRTILARICTFDTSIGDPTGEQLEEAVEFLETVMQIGAPQSEGEQATVQRAHDIILQLVSAQREPAPEEGPAPDEGTPPPEEQPAGEPPPEEEIPEGGGEEPPPEGAM